MEKKMEDMSPAALVNELEKYPHFKTQVESIIKLLHNESVEGSTADQIEEALVGKMRKMGNVLLHEWAGQQEKKLSEAAIQSGLAAKKHDKKKLDGTLVLEMLK
jgi:hypothetical protein